MVQNASRILAFLICAGILIVPARLSHSSGRDANDSPTKDAAARLFARDNLVAWCIVPFDAKKRGPIERVEMLQKLGFRRYAYDWRDEHLPTFDTEVAEL